MSRISEGSVQEALSIIDDIGPIWWEFQDECRSVLFCINVSIPLQEIESLYSVRILSAFRELFPSPPGSSAWQVDFYGQNGVLIGVCLEGGFARAP